MKVKFATFSDGSIGLRAAGKRLVKQADATGWFDYPSEHWTLDTLSARMPEFLDTHQKIMKTHPKGLGLWVWKPAILSFLVEQLHEDEIIVFVDAGCQLNLTEESAVRFKEYLEICMAQDMLFMQLANNSFGFGDVTEVAWTKQSVLEALDPSSTFRFSNQIQSGIIMAKKSRRSERVSKKWLDYCLKSDYFYLLDPPRSELQSQDFQQHRWEQSILSLIVKSEGITPLQDETYFYPNWGVGRNFPIWAMRNRSGGNAYRRNFIDLILISLAKIERNLKKILWLNR